MSTQQTVLRVQFDNVNSTTGITQYEFLDLYGDVPIKINKSFAELQDISKRNSDYSIGLQLPGSKKNNKFFENFFNVDTQSLYFDANKRVPCNVLLDDVSYFSGYMRLNKTSVLDSKVEYSVTLYSTIGDLFGNIGNGLLNELNFDDPEYNFNHTFDQYAVTNDFNRTIFSIDGENPTPYFYPIVHNGYSYTANTNNQLVVDLSGNTATSPVTRLYTSTGPINNYPSQVAAFAAGVQKYRINTPNQGLIDNQLKPALNIYSLIQLIFKKYGYTIKSDFFNTPWFKASYMYGYFSSDSTKFSYQIPQIQTLPLEGVSIIFVSAGINDFCYVTKLGTGIPCFCSSNIDVVFQYDEGYSYGIVDYQLTIQAGTTGVTSSYGGTFYGGYSSQVPNGTSLSYLPQPAGTTIPISDGMLVDFSKVINKDLKQIDLLSSIAKKFNLVFVPDPEVQNQIIIEPYNYYIGTGDIHDWSDKISYDKGFSVEPALNYIESELFLSDLEDGDYGNLSFKNSNSRIYGQNIVYNPTDFKSQQKKIDTIFSPELIRTWDDNISLPLGINYVGTTETVKSGGNEIIQYVYKGVRTKPKLMFWLGGFNPFLDTLGEVYSYSGTTNYATYNVYISDSDGNVNGQFQYIPIISHTMPVGNPDTNKGPNRGFNNDSICNLFNSEQPIRIGTTETYNVYTENDIYNLFYSNRIDNLYNPNTRFLKGQFNLKYNDIQNLKPNDLIKINEQYFTWNKIDGFNLTNRELTQVELIQTNNNPSQYPTRYFSYSYCDNPGTCFKFKTDFTNPNLRDTNYFWSILYDYNIGILGGSATGFTSSFLDFQNNTGKYVPYYMTEITEYDYNTSLCQNWTCDTLMNYIYDETQFSPFNTYIPGFWFSSGINDLPFAANTKQGLNVFSGCTQFNTAATTYGILTGTSIYHGAAQCPTPTPTPTPTPLPPCINTGTGFNDEVWDIELQADNKILVGGLFTQYNGNSVDMLCRLNYDGSIDSTFSYNDGGTPATNVVYDILVQPDQKILRIDIGGLKRLNTNGSFDTGFNHVYWNIPGGSYEGGEERMGLQSDGKIIFGGRFTGFTSSGSTIVTSTKRYIGRLNTDGTIDTTFNSGGTGFAATTGETQFEGVQDISILADDKILVVGTFQQYNGVACNSFIKLNADGSVDTSFTLDTPTSTFGIHDVEVQSTGKILCGLAYTINYLGYSCRGIFRLNSNGTFDTSYPYNAFSGFTYDIKVDSSDNIYWGGQIENSPNNTYNGTVVTDVFKLTSNGVLDTSFNVGTGPNNDIKDIEIDYQNRVLIGGLFTSYNGVTANRLIRLSSNGSIYCPPSPTSTPTPTATIVASSTPTPTPTGTPAASPTGTPTGTPVVTTTPTPTLTVTPTRTSVPFSMTLNTTAEGSNYLVRLPYYSGGTYSGTINWGDGSTSGNTYANNAHTYVTGGTYTITITGVINGFNTGYNTTDGVSINRVLTSVNQFGNNFSFGTNDPGKFERCKLLTSVASDIPLSGVNFKQMFNLCTVFNQDISSWNVSIGGDNMRDMFRQTSFNQNINSWNVSGVTDMKSMFQQTPFNQPLSGWNVSNVTIMDNMFNSSTFNQNIGGWNVSGVTSMSGMLIDATSFTTTNLDNIYNGWSALPSLQSNVPFGASVCYTATTGRGILTGTYNWTITDGGVC